jgi:hypothetical protein
MAKKEEDKKSEDQVTFTEEQLQIVNKLIEKGVARSKEISGSTNSDGISVYGQRDPKSVDTVNVKRYDGKFVVGFKNLQKDPMKKDTPKYIRYDFDPVRKLNEQPFITLLLSDNGKDIEEKEVSLGDYYRNREYFQADVVEMKEEEVVQDHGILSSSGDMAREIDDKGQPVRRSNVKAQTRRIERRFVVDLPGFKDKVEFISDFLA